MQVIMCVGVAALVVVAAVILFPFVPETSYYYSFFLLRGRVISGEKRLN